MKIISHRHPKMNPPRFRPGNNVEIKVFHLLLDSVNRQLKSVRILQQTLIISLNIMPFSRKSGIVLT